jgi:hypothetical protein
MRTNSLATCRWTLGLLVLTLFPTATLRGDRVELDTGAVVEGKVLRITTHDVSVALRSGGAISFQKRNIRLVRVSGVATISADELALLNKLPTSTEQYQRLLGKANARAPSPAPRNWQSNGAVNSPLRPESLTGAVGATTPQPYSPPRAAVPPAPPATRPASPNALSLHLAKSPSSTDPSSKSRAVEVFSSRPSSNPDTVDPTPLAFEFEPPTGFVPWPPGEVFPVVKAYRNPVTEATLTVSSYVGEKTLIELKERTAESYRNQPRKYLVARDEVLGDTQHETLLLEVTSHFAGLSVHQSQFFTGIPHARGSRALVVTLSTTSTHAPQYRDPMLRSLRTLRLREATQQDALPRQLEPFSPPIEPHTQRKTGKADGTRKAQTFPDALPEFDPGNSVERSSLE